MSSSTCVVCLNAFSNPVTLGECRHLLCMTCLSDVAGPGTPKTVTCPTCRRFCQTVYPPNHNRVLREMCLEMLTEGERASAARQWSEFQEAYDVFRSSRRWPELDGTKSVHVDRWVSLQRLSPEQKQTMVYAKRNLQQNKDAALRLRQQAKNHDILVSEGRKRVQTIASAIP